MVRVFPQERSADEQNTITHGDSLAWLYVRPIPSELRKHMARRRDGPSLTYWYLRSVHRWRWLPLARVQVRYKS